MIAHFFIDRPIFAAVLSIVITLTGGIAAFSLPIAQYPQITPPSVQISINYPGASAQVVADTVAAPIEQQVNGVEGMLYMSSQMGNDGSYTLSVTFDLGTDLNTALVMVQNRVALAMPQLPSSVQQQGITIKKKTPDLLLIVSFLSPNDRYDDIYLSNYATIYAKDELFRVDGVSDITYLGQRDYSIRVWLDPQKLASRNMAATDVADAIRSQNLQAVAGQIGSPPAPAGQSSQAPLATVGRLAVPEQFGDIIVKVVQASPPLPATAAAPVPSSSASSGGSGPTLGGLGSGFMHGLTLSGMLPAMKTIASGTTAGTSGTSGSTTTSNMSTGNSGTTSSGLSGGATTGGGATAVGGGTTGGGATTGGGGTTGGAATGTPGSAATSSATAATGLAMGGANMSTMSVGGGTSISALSPPPVGGASTGGGPQPPDAAIVRLRDVARIEMGAQNYNISCTFDGHPSVGLGIHQLPGTNALDVAERVRRKMEELKTRFPEGVDYQIAYDTTPYIRESVNDVVHTLLEAVVLVGLVVLVFLQNWRAILIPLLAVPVAIVGTFAAMAALGFSLNNISLFGLVLAIGIVVDDAIVVVENVERWLEEGHTPRDAARKAMDEVTGPVIAVALVLCAVFVPCAFISGITGQFFRQFALTIAVSTVISAFNSLTLSPALAAILLRPRGASRDPLTRLLNALLGWFFRLFNATFGASQAAYAWVVGVSLRASPLVLLGYGGLGVLTWWVFARAPTGFIPEQDQGRLIVNVQLPDSASLSRTKQAVAQIDKITRATPGVADTITVSGLSFVQSANSSNFASLFVILDPFEKRQTPELRDTAIIARLRRAWHQQIKDAQVIAFRAPAIPGLSVAGGFKLMVEDQAGLGLTSLQRETDKLIQQLNKEPGFTGVSTQFRSNTPQLFLDIDRTKAASLGVSLNDINQALQIYLGSLYVNSFNAFGRYWQVTLQAEGNFRDRVPDINMLQVRNNAGQMVSARHAGQRARNRRACLRRALQPLLRGAGYRKPAHRYQLGRRHRDRRPPVPAEPAPLHGNGVDRVDVHADSGGQHGHDRLCPVGRLCLLGARRVVRELVAAVGRDPGCAAVLALLADRRPDHAQRRQYLCTNRPGGIGRAGLQELDSDRRIRKAIAPGGEAPVRGDKGGVAAAAAADRDDLVRVHPGSGPAGGCRWGRGGNAAFAGNGRLQRHDRSDAVRHLSHAGILLRDSEFERKAAASEHQCASGSPVPCYPESWEPDADCCWRESASFACRGQPSSAVAPVSSLRSSRSCCGSASQYVWRGP